MRTITSQNRLEDLMKFSCEQDINTSTDNKIVLFTAERSVFLLLFYYIKCLIS